MAVSYSTSNQRPATATSPPSVPQAEDFRVLTRMNLYSFSFPSIFNIISKPTQQLDAARIIRNLGKFSLHYAIFTWTSLFITLVWNDKVSMAYLVAMTRTTLPYCVLLRVLPDVVALQEEVDRRLLLFLVFVVLIIVLVILALDLMLTHGDIIFLFLTLAATALIIALHAALSKGDDEFVNEKAGMLLASCVVLQKADGEEAENLV